MHDLINKLGRYIDESASLANPDVPDHSGRDFPEFRKNEHQLFHLEALGADLLLELGDAHGFAVACCLRWSRRLACGCSCVVAALFLQPLCSNGKQGTPTRCVGLVDDFVRASVLQR